MEVFKRILSLIGPYRKRFILALATTVLFVLAGLVSPYITRALVDDVIEGGRLELLVTLLGLLVSISLLSAGIIYARSLLFEGVSQSVVFQFRQDLYEHLHELPYRFYDHNQIGEIMSRMTSDLDAIRQLLAGGLSVLVEHGLYLVGALWMVIIMDYRLGLILLPVLPLVAYFTIRFDKRIRPQHAAMREQNAVLNSRAQENISGVRVVKAYAREEHEINMFNEQNNRHLSIGTKITNIAGDYNAILDFIGSLPQALLVLFGGWLASNGTISAGTLIAVIGYIWMIMMPLRNLGNTANMVVQAIASSDRLFYYLDFGSYIKEKDNPYAPEKITGHVKFENVYFNYEDEAVLEDISFEVKPGQTLAIMGATGTGKTSIVNLLGRFYEVKSGRVLIDGRDVRDYKLQNLRRQIGYVMQETFLFSDTLENNIAFGRLDATDEELQRAAQISNTAEFLNKLDEKYGTIVGERGMGLSGGQKQRVAIARALCYNPRILVLDDATSSVDMETEYNIQQELKKIMHDRVTFIISHRISAVKDADEIIVLDNKRIAERGQHADLLRKRGLYYDIFMDQYQDYEAISGQRLVID